MAIKHEDSLLHQSGIVGWIYLVVLLMTFCIQTLALFVPFMSIDVILVGSDVYSLPHSVKLMWQSELYIVAILIAFFSITFPFLKLASLLLIWIAVPPTHNRKRVLHWLGLLGKWSMLDPFIVILLIVLATDQWAVSTQTFSGVYLFLAGIASAITLSTVAMQVDRAFNPAHKHTYMKVADPDRKTVLIRASGWLGIAGPTTVAISGVCFLIALITPFFQLDQFLLSSDSYSILSSVTALIQSKQPALAALVAITLIIAPGMALVQQVWIWVTPATAAMHHSRNRRLRILHEWCMLEVFALGLLLFLWEGKALMNTEVRAGLWIITTTIVIYYSGSFVSLVALERITKRMCD
ncbi:MAG: paraquat-inducible protein A [Planctomycetes bacterium]|nr:paraquat-inducible protein A [Planctomycetota bacterium]